MALHSKEDFIKLCGIKGKRPKNQLNTYAKRGKIVFSGEYIDDSIPENRDFMQSRLEKKQEKLKKDIKELGSVDYPDRSNKKTPNVQDPDTNKISIDRKLKLQQLEKLEVDTRLQELKERKLLGEIVPAELVKDTFSRFSQNTLNSMNDYMDKWITLFAGQYGLSTEETIKYRTEIKESLNHANDRAVQETINEFDSLIAQHSEKRSPGERK